jgi:small conductance mechanosensitive channel
MRQFMESFAPRELLVSFLEVLAVLLLGLLVLRLVDTALKRVARIVPTDEVHLARLDHRTETLRHFVRSLGNVVLAVLIVILVAAEFGRDLTAPLVGAGIVGLAIGFGAQSLVKDVIAGFFVLLEDQYGIGETVRIGTQEGVVEKMTLRVTVLRSADGEVHVIPNGSVQTVTVLSRDWRRALVDVEVAPGEELGRVFGILSQVGESLARDMSGRIIEKPTIVGVERMTRLGVTIRLAVKTLPARQAEIAHEWRRRIKDAFDREGIRLADGAPAV